MNELKVTGRATPPLKKPEQNTPHRPDASQTPILQPTMATEGLKEPSIVTKEQTAKISTAARLAISNGPATIAAERKTKKKKASK